MRVFKKNFPQTLDAAGGPFYDSFPAPQMLWKVIWIYNILLTEKSGQHFAQGPVSLGPQASRVSGKRLAPVRSRSKGNHPRQPMTKAEHTSSLFPERTSQVDLLTKIWSAPSNMLLWCFDADWPRIWQRQAGSPLLEWLRCAFRASHRVGGAPVPCPSKPWEALGRGGQTAPPPCQEDYLLAAPATERTSLWDGWKAKWFPEPQALGCFLEQNRHYNSGLLPPYPRLGWP